MKNSILSWSTSATLRTRNALARWVGGCVHCGASGAVSSFSTRLCQGCADGLTGLDVHRCQGCAVVLNTDNALCLDCLQSAPSLRHVTAFADYHGALQHLILNYKFHNMLQAAPVLGDVLQTTLARYARQHAADVIVPVPQFDAHTRTRGFVPLNHLLQQVDWARAFQTPPLLRTDATVRLHHAHLQVSSTPEQRRKQVKGAFAATHDFTGQRVVLVDDVYTTGATLNELAAVCLAAGAKSVDALVLARARRVK